MTRLSTFDANVTSPIIRALAAGRSLGDLRGILDEVIALACPFCGHITPDHSWTPNQDGIHVCLVRQNTLYPESTQEPSETPPCACPGFSADKEPGEDQDVFEALIRLEVLFGIVIAQDLSWRVHERYGERINALLSAR